MNKHKAKIRKLLAGFGFNFNTDETTKCRKISLRSFTPLL